MEAINLKPNIDESPAEYADRLGIYYTSSVSDNHKKELGQFFTPIRIAQFMGSIINARKDKLRILDPGCGIGILSASLCEEISKSNLQIKSIELVAFETDVEILPFSDLCFTHLSNWLKLKGIEFTYFLCKNDFILHNSKILIEDIKKSNERYDFIISNPPYFKLRKDDVRVVSVQGVIFGQTNIYSIFLLIAAKLLGKNGQMVFITPRSFCSGNYFRLFRELFFDLIDIQLVHLFDSRKDSFKRDSVLQENIIISARKKNKEKKINNHEVLISSSKGISDLSKRQTRIYKWNNLININSYQKILHLPSSDIDENVINIFKTWTGSLKIYGLKISTGPVVDFRSVEFINFKKRKNRVPLIWLHNIESMNIIWPKKSGQGKPKGQYILHNQKSESRLVKNKNYVLIRRFSTKEDSKRLIAAPYIKTNYAEVDMIGIENHLNYIYSINDELTNEEVYGIAAILNSRLFDIYFRTFNGNINVSATELRDFPLPNYELIKNLGRIILASNNLTCLNVDNLIAEIFKLPENLYENYENI